MTTSGLLGNQKIVSLFLSVTFYFSPLLLSFLSPKFEILRQHRRREGVLNVTFITDKHCLRKYSLKHGQMAI